MAAANYEFGLYSATIAEVLLCVKEGPDKETGQTVEKEYLAYEVALVQHEAKTGEITPLEHRPIVKFTKWLVGGAMTGKAGEITTKQLQATAGELLVEHGRYIFMTPLNASLVGRGIKVLCSANPGKPNYPNWEVFSPGVAAPKTEVSKRATSVLDSMFRPAKKAVTKPPTVTDAPASDYGEDVPF